MSRKPRSDAKLKSLPPNQREMLVRWLVDENLSYDQAVERLEKDFNVRTSVGALSAFYATECYSVRSSEAKEFAERVEQELLQGEPNFDLATLALVKKKLFERAYARDGDVDELAVLAKIIGDTAKLRLKEKDQEIATRRLAILEKKAAQADEAKSVAASEDLSAEEKERRLKAVFGIT
jgi:hypothetical protein